MSERTAQILDAAYVCFTRHGVARTTMDDIAREAGMSRPAVYTHVRNKEDAFRQLAQRLFNTALDRARMQASAAAGLTAALTAALTAKLDLTMAIWRDSPHAAELLGDNARLSADLDAQFTTAMRDLLAGIIRAHCPRAEAEELAEVLLALTRGLEADLSDPQVPPRRLRRGIALLVAGLSTTSTQELT